MCTHLKPWAVLVEAEVITENGRRHPGRSFHEFWCRKCGDVLERKWIDESLMSFGDALSYAGIKSWEEARKLPVEPEAQTKADARFLARLEPCPQQDEASKAFNAPFEVETLHVVEKRCVMRWVGPR